MNSTTIIIIISVLTIFTSSMDVNYSKYKLKNFGLRFLVFKKKSAPKILNKLKKFYDKCYERSVVSIGEGMNDYNNNFTEEEKIIIETILALCY